MATAIRTEGLTKRYGDVVALDHLDLEVAPGEVVGYLGPTAPGKTTTIRLLLGLAGPRRDGRDLRARLPAPARRGPPAPGLRAPARPTSGRRSPARETLALLGRVHGEVDEAYRDELVGRFDLDPTKKVRAYSKGNRQKVILIAALMVRPDLLVLDEPTSGLDPLMEQAFRHCIARGPGPRPDRLPLLAHAERGRGPLRPGGHPARGQPGRDRHPGRDAPPQRAHRGGDLRRHRPRPLRRPRGERGRGGRARGPLPGPWSRRAPPRGPGRRRRDRAAEPGALARGAVPRPLRRGRPWHR